MNRAIAPSYSTGQPICKAAIDLAVFDLTGKLLGQSAAERWGRQSGQPVTLSWTLNPRELNEVEGLIEQARARGYDHFNVKIAPEVKFDLELCRLIKRLAPEAVLWADANGGYDTATAFAVAPKLADLGVAFFEQPVPANRLSGFAELKQQGALPIIMDEGVLSLTDLEEFHRLNLLDGVAMKVVRCGGLAEARKMVEFIQENGLLFLGSGLTDPDLSLAASLLLYSAYGLEYPAALNGPQFLTASILREPFSPVGGRLCVPGGSGLGVEVDEAKVAALRLDNVA
jgi:L-alanine-DL-glutamate epimerase-like enolase superfamily enzyme